MDEGIKQRLVGVLVLVIAAMFLVPWVFDQHIVRHVAEQIAIPPQPEPAPSLLTDNEISQPIPTVPPITKPISTPAISKNLPSKSQEDIDSLYKDAVKGESFLQSAPLDDQGLPIAWSLQVASFSSKANARSLISKLESGGYKSYMTNVMKADGGQLVRVFVGPDLQRSKIKLYKDQLEQRYQLKGLIVRYRTN